MSKLQKMSWSLHALVLFVAVSVVLVFFTGCEPLRKKFVRKSKKEKETEVIPLLEPIEYPSVKYSAEGLYRYHYSLWQVWHKDLMTSLLEGDSDKRIVYLLDQLMIQLQSMQKLLTEAKQPLLVPMIEQLARLKEAYGRPQGLRNELWIETQARSIDRYIRQDFSLKKIRGFLRQGEIKEDE